MAMIIFNLIVFFNVKVSLFFSFLTPLGLFFWFLVVNLLFVVLYFFYLFFFPYFFVEVAWGIFFFGCDLISYGLIQRPQ
jgi:hypothetical protein